MIQSIQSVDRQVDRGPAGTVPSDEKQLRGIQG